MLEESLSHPLKLWGAPEKRATVKALVLPHPTSTVSLTTIGNADPQFRPYQALPFCYGSSAIAKALLETHYDSASQFQGLTLLEAAGQSRVERPPSARSTVVNPYSRRN